MTTKNPTSAENKPEDSVLVVNDLTKEFGGLTAVDDLSFRVEHGEILGFIGPNGAGKSTTFNCVTGVYPPTEGKVYFKGRDITGSNPHDIVEMGMNRTFQETVPLNDRSVVKNIQLALYHRGLKPIYNKTKHQKMAESICHRIGLGDVMQRKPSELPHAGILKLELGRAIATKPDLVLVDEPFAGLTDDEISELSEVMESLRQHGMTLIVVDHNMRGLLNLIDRAFVIQFGSKIAEGDPDEIKNDPKVQEAYLGGDEI